MELARHGATVVVNDVGGSVRGEGAGRDADLTVDIIKGRGGAATSNYADVADYDAVGELVSSTVEQHGRLDILVNNAGISGANGTVEEISEAEWDKVMNTNAKSVFLCTKHAVPLLRRAGGGRPERSCSSFCWLGSCGAVTRLTPGCARPRASWC